MLKLALRKNLKWPTIIVLLMLVLTPIACQSQAPAPGGTGPSDKKVTEAQQPAAKSADTAVSKTEAKQPADNKASMPAKRYKVRVAQIYVSGALGPYWLAQDAGIFDKYGIDLENTFMQGSAMGTQALIAGSVDVEISAPSDATLGASAQGSDIVILGSLSNSLEYRLIVVPSIQTPADLNGKTFMISRPGGSDDRLTRVTLEKLGVDLKSVSWMSIGAHPERLAAMMQNQGHGTIVTPPTTLMFLKAGFREMVKLADLNIPYVASTVHANGKWVRENPEAAEGFLKAIIEGIHIYRTNKELGMKTLEKNMKIDDPASLESTYESTALAQDKYLETNMQGLQDQIEEAAAQSDKIKGLKAADLVDFTLIKKIKASGFIDSLPWR